MNEPLLNRSKGGAYENTARAIVKANDDNQDGSPSMSPDIVAHTIVKAINTRSPKTRYAVGKGAKPMLFLRYFLTDKIFDRIVLGLVK